MSPRKKSFEADPEIWDVAVIGGGPAGMMAAGRAAELGAKVFLIEKNSSLGKKLLITGGGRCNITNAEFDTRTFLSKFKQNDKFLFSAFSEFSVTEALDFFHIRGLETKIEAEKRVFPVTDKTQSVWDVLVNYMKESGVTVLSNSPVLGFETEGKQITAINLKNKKIFARSIILATGGKSRPETGSTGEGFDWLHKLRHTIHASNAALVPIALKDAWVKKLSGVALKDIKITVFQNRVKQEQRKGKMLFTHVGVSGPAILNLSRDIGELLKYGEVTLELDLLPMLDYSALNSKLQEILLENAKKKIKNSLSALIPSALIETALELSHIDPATLCSGITREQRLALEKTLKHLPMHVKGLLGLDKAVVTSGGVALDEVDFKTMRSRLISNLFLVGDILNIDRPSGGYSLQLCWTTGFVAGSAATKN